MSKAAAQEQRRTEWLKTGGNEQEKRTKKEVRQPLCSSFAERHLGASDRSGDGLAAAAAGDAGHLRSHGVKAVESAADVIILQPFV